MADTLKKEIVKAINEVCENSTMHSLPNLVRNESILIKIISLVVLLGGIAGCAYFYYQAISGFLNFDVNTTYENKIATKLKVKIKIFLKF